MKNSDLDSLTTAQLVERFASIFDYLADALAIADAYASALSRFHSDESMDEFYPYSAKRDVEDNLRGYDLYESGRIRRRQ